MCDDGVHLEEDGVDILAKNCVNNVNDLYNFFTRENLDWQGYVYDEPESSARTIPVHLNDCHNPEQNVFSS